MNAEYHVTAVQHYKETTASIEHCVTVSRQTFRDYYYTFIASNGSALIFELKFGLRCRTDRVADLKVSNVYIYAAKVFLLHENKILLAIYNYQD